MRHRVFRDRVTKAAPSPLQMIRRLAPINPVGRRKPQALGFYHAALRNRKPCPMRR